MTSVPQVYVDQDLRRIASYVQAAHVPLVETVALSDDPDLIPLSSFYAAWSISSIPIIQSILSSCLSNSIRSSVSAAPYDTRLSHLMAHLQPSSVPVFNLCPDSTSPDLLSEAIPEAASRPGAAVANAGSSVNPPSEDEHKVSGECPERDAGTDPVPLS